MLREYHKTTLKNGLRIITIPKPDSPSATVMVLVGVGSRHEPDQLSGISHFIEHNVFKGTKNRPRRNQIAQEIEGLGGVTNAATGHEYTYYWAKAAASKVEKILDVVMDVSLHMSFPKKDLEVERRNVIEEINMYQDHPMQRLAKNFLDFVWDGHSVGRTPLGTKKTIGQVSRAQMLKFVRQNYLPARMMAVVAGAVKVKKIESQIRDYYASIPSDAWNRAGVERFEEFQTEPRLFLDNDQTQQTHLALGVKTFGRHDERRFTLDVLNNVLGQGMSSRLFRKIREEMGLAYYVRSSGFAFDETGLWYARAGVDNGRVRPAIKAILGEFIKLMRHRVGRTELRKAKEFIKGSTLLGIETSDDLAGWYGFQELLEDEVLSPDEYNERIETVTAGEMREVAQDLLREDRLNLGLVGPLGGHEREFMALLKLN